MHAEKNEGRNALVMLRKEWSEVMANVTRKELSPGVFLTAVQTDKFKTCVMGAFLLSPLREETAAENALIPDVLRRGTAQYPDMESLSAALDELYGGSIDPVVRKLGECQCVGLAGSFVDDRFLPGQEPMLEQAAGLLGSLLLDPATEHGVFRGDYVEGEKQNLIDDIRAVINEKRQYSIKRVLETMCSGEAFGVDKLGSEESARAIAAKSLWQRYETLLKTARVELYFCGSAEPERAENALRNAFAALPGGGTRENPGCTVIADAEETRTVEERMDVTQGKLAMGFRTGGITMDSPEYPALLLMNAVFGGTTTSKLFMNVREKLSLCYFASSMIDRRKGILLVSSGIEFDKYEQAKSEIMAQLEACRKGEIEDWELEGARRSVISALEVTADNQGRQEDYWLGQAAADASESPEELAARVERVTREEVAAAAKKLSLDTIYFLKGMEG